MRYLKAILLLPLDFITGIICWLSSATMYMISIPVQRFRSIVLGLDPMKLQTVQVSDELQKKIEEAIKNNIDKN